jgi:hypothetical protein
MSKMRDQADIEAADLSIGFEDVTGSRRNFEAVGAMPFPPGILARELVRGEGIEPPTNSV